MSLPVVPRTRAPSGTRQWPALASRDRRHQQQLRAPLPSPGDAVQRSRPWARGAGGAWAGRQGAPELQHVWPSVGLAANCQPLGQHLASCPVCGACPPRCLRCLRCQPSALRRPRETQCRCWIVVPVEADAVECGGVLRSAVERGGGRRCSVERRVVIERTLEGRSNMTFGVKHAVHEDSPPCLAPCARWQPPVTVRLCSFQPRGTERLASSSDVELAARSAQLPMTEFPMRRDGRALLASTYRAGIRRRRPPVAPAGMRARRPVHRRVRSTHRSTASAQTPPSVEADVSTVAGAPSWGMTRNSGRSPSCSRSYRERGDDAARGEAGQANGGLLDAPTRGSKGNAAQFPRPRSRARCVRGAIGRRPRAWGVPCRQVANVARTASTNGMSRTGPAFRLQPRHQNRPLANKSRWWRRIRGENNNKHGAASSVHRTVGRARRRARVKLVAVSRSLPFSPHARFPPPWRNDRGRSMLLASAQQRAISTSGKCR
ncbi:hypothetical protein RJ55_02890 [Drechmeria coniospora]|nr:hypothetical protein RJ55_02890 [Drechmeria coniospora]